DRRRCLLMIAVVEQAVAIVDDGHRLEQVDAEGILRVDVEDRRRTPDRLRAETRARPVGDGGVEGDAPHDGVGTLHILGEAAPHERQRAGIGRFRLAAHGFAGGEGAVDGIRGHWSVSSLSGAASYWPDMTLAQQKSGRSEEHTSELQSRENL